MDRDRDDSVTPEEVLQFLNENRIFDVSLNELRYVIDFFDCTGLSQGKLNYIE